MKNGRLSDDFIDLTTKLMLARERSEIMRIASDFNSTIERLIQAENHTESSIKRKATTCTLKFTKEEISKVKMATTFKKEFIANGLVAHITKRESGKNSYCYEIRYRSNGYKIEASSTNLTEAKRKFLAKTAPEEIEKYQTKKVSTGYHLLFEVFEEWYLYRSKAKVTKKVLNTHRSHFVSLPENIKMLPISKIGADLIISYLEQFQDRMYEEYRTLFNMLFKFAKACGYISINPMNMVPFVRAERQIRDALSEEEIYRFLNLIKLPRYDKIRQAAYLYYFFGLRASEIDEETRREGDFLITRNRKRKNGKIEYKKIPIPSQAQGLIDWDKPFVIGVTVNTATKWFHEILGEDKSAYNLRHTFSSICQQYVRQDIVEIWIGDSPQRLIGKVYTHFPDKFMREQMDLVIFPTF